MANKVNLRELILNILLEIDKEGQYSHLVLRSTLEKYQYLEKQERAFITRVCEGTLEYRIRLDYILDQFSTVPAEKMNFSVPVYTSFFIWIMCRTAQYVMKQ